MGLCSCKAECNCAISAADPDNGLLLIEGDGNPELGGWKLRVVETEFAATGDGAIDIEDGGSYGHGPTFALKTVDSGTVALEVTGDGLVAHALGVGSAGGGTPTGVVEDYIGDVAPPGYVMASGPNYAGYIPIVDAPGLYGLVGHSESGGVDPGDGTFLVPYLGEKFLLGSGGPYVKGAIGGEATVGLTAANNGPHGHGITDPGHGHPGSTSTDGEHVHTTATAGRHFIEAETATIDQRRFQTDPGGDTDLVTDANDGNTTYGQKSDAGTAANGAHDHDVTIGTSGTGITVNSDGSGTPHNNMPPYRVVHRIIKT